MNETIPTEMMKLIEERPETSDNIKRREKEHTLFGILDSDSNHHLNQDELFIVAKQFGFTGSEAQWPDVYRSLREESNFPEAGMDREAFEEGVDAQLDDRQLDQLLRDLQVNQDIAPVDQQRKTLPSDADAEDSQYIEALFNNFDADSDRHLNQGELLVAAKQIGIFTASDDQWPKRYMSLDIPMEGMGLPTFAKGLAPILSDEIRTLLMRIQKSHMAQDNEPKNQRSTALPNELASQDATFVNNVLSTDAEAAASEADAEAVFANFDVDRDGVLKQDELLVVVKQMGLFTLPDDQWPKEYMSLREGLEFPMEGMDLATFVQGLLAHMGSDELHKLLMKSPKSHITQNDKENEPTAERINTWA
jgi:Ca2+-binding EF-hand superfamily protein